jgi:uncharacterized cupin superfamily protein
MHVTRFDQARSYDAKGHFSMLGLQLQGGAASTTDGVTVSLSYFLPGGGADRSASPTEKFYVVLEGSITVLTDAGEENLGPLDSCRLAPGEARAIVNRNNVITKMLVVISAPREPK